MLSDDVAEWGRRWLAQWVAEAPSDDARSVREDVAAHWAEYTLEDWIEAAARPKSRDLAARTEARGHLALYQREQAGLLVWRAYREYRAAGLPVAEPVLQVFDQWARSLEDAHDADAVAGVVMAGGGAKHLAAVERQRRIVSDVEALIVCGVKPAAAERRVAAARGLAASAVHAMRGRWHSRRTKANKRTAVDILRMLGRP